MVTDSKRGKHASRGSGLDGPPRVRASIAVRADLASILFPVLRGVVAILEERLLSVDARRELMAAPAPISTAAFSASQDFRSIIHLGVPYSLTGPQGHVTQMLWEAHANGTPDLGSATLLAAIDSHASDLRDVFRSNNKISPAWGTVIVAGGSKGSVRLALP